jgi:predicted dehydrogenase
VKFDSYCEAALRENVSKRWRKSYKFVLIGCGRVGYAYATVINSHPEMTLAAVVDVNPESAHAFGNSFRCSAYTSLDDYFAANNPSDCGVVCAPSSEHSSITSALLQRQINVLCEQPFALDCASAERMVDVSRTYGVSLMMGSRFRFVPDIIHARGLIQAGILGQVLEFEADFRDPVDMRNRWNIRNDISGGGVLIDSGCSAVDLARYFFGPISGVRAEEGCRVQSEDVEDTVRLAIRTASNVLGTVHLSWTLKNPGDDYLRIYGTQGNLCIGWRKSMYRPHGTMDWINFGEGYNTQKALTLQTGHFVNVIVGEEIPEISADDELESVRTIQTAYQSLHTGRFLNIHPDPAPTAASLKKHNLAVVPSESSFPTWLFK